MRSLLLVAAALLVVLNFAPVASAAPQCSPREVHEGPITIVNNSDCSTIISEKAYDCTWGGHYSSTTVGKVTVRVFECDSPYPPPL